ncbi:MAG: hypothetical protein Tsb0013_13570 [Phycisphaerales bacterium]
MRTPVIALALILAPAAVLSSACSTYRETGEAETPRERLLRQADESRRAFRQQDPTMIDFFDNAYGYALFPRVTKGAAGIGAANGDGVVYEQGRLIGYADLTQVNVGLQLGGQSFSQVIFFQDGVALDRFKRGEVEFSANASAVAAESGAAASADYEEGVAVFSMTRGGLMFEASIGGQDFDFEPID